MRSLLAVLLLFLPTCLGCATEQEAPAVDRDAAPSEVVVTGGADGAAPPPGRAYRAMADQVEAEAVSAPAAPLDRAAQFTGQKLIKTGLLHLEIDDYAQTRARMLERVAAHEAYIASESETRHGGTVRNHTTLRVPADRFDALVDDLVALADVVVQKDVSVRDVTEEVVDVEARLRTRRDVEARYREILTQARTIDDILNVERRLQVVREEIEAAEGRLNVLRDRVAFSTIELTYYKPQPFSRPDRSFLTRVVRAARSGWIGLQDGAVALVAIWPLLLFGALCVGGMLALRRRVRRKRMEPA